MLQCLRNSALSSMLCVFVAVVVVVVVFVVVVVVVFTPGKSIPPALEDKDNGRQLCFSTC